MSRGQLSTERNKIDPDNYTEYNQLPLVATGCDSYASWDPRFKRFSPMLTIPEIVERIRAILPNGKFGIDCHLILTGGEPLLGWQRTFPELLDQLQQQLGLTDVTFETNGTQKLTDLLRDYIKQSSLNFFFSISAKLPVSGEKFEDAIVPNVVAEYFCSNNVTGAFKFVVAEHQDFDDVCTAVDQYQSAGINIPVYVMPVGGVNEVYSLNNKTVAETAMKLGYRYSPRLQVELWKNAWAT